MKFLQMPLSLLLEASRYALLTLIKHICGNADEK